VFSEQELDRVRAVKAAHEQDLLQKANVVGVGIGLRTRPHGPAGELAVVVSVTHKVPLAELDPGDVIPRELEGVPVEIRTVGTLRAL